MVNVGPHVLDHDTASSEGNLNVLLPVLPVTELGHLVEEVSQITTGESDVGSLGEVTDGNTKLVKVLWEIQCNVVIDVEARVNNAHET